MAFGFPLYIDLKGNNCVVIGGGRSAAHRVQALMKFGAQITVISPTLCDPLQKLDSAGKIRYIPRRYYRGDCTNAYLCVAATNQEAVNIAVSDECKAKGVPVNVVRPAAFGNFSFPAVVLYDNITISISGNIGSDTLQSLCSQIERQLPDLLKEARNAEDRFTEE